MKSTPGMVLLKWRSTTLPRSAARDLLAVPAVVAWIQRQREVFGGLGVRLEQREAYHECHNGDGSFDADDDR
jgi:hypothetical protein